MINKFLSFIVSLIILLSIVLFFVFYLEENETDFELLQREGDDPMPTGLHPKVAKKRDQLVARAEEKGIEVVITEGFRTIKEQEEIYERGRSEKGNIVTYAEGGESYHNYGLAIDFALRNKNEKVIWDTEYDGNGNGKSDWMEVVEIAKDLGFDWGGDWRRFKDYPHFQMDMGYSIRELKNGFRPEIPKGSDQTPKGE
ncbi:M15 family metallopeptidase [Thalassobacillus devorans]|uniref:M15 family metallopeptidase n=1 Tax=Thalassobacillus devorans TaxID=279813 RepID=UPI0004B5557E|nr:M15 family metallopeptidase [Thalassobacillus devorans]